MYIFNISVSIFNLVSLPWGALDVKVSLSTMLI